MPHSHSNERKLSPYTWKICLDFHWNLSSKGTQSVLIFTAFTRILSIPQWKYRETLSYPKTVHGLDFPMMWQRVKTGKAEMMAWGNTTTQEENTFNLFWAYGPRHEVLRCYFCLLQAALSVISKNDIFPSLHTNTYVTYTYSLFVEEKKEGMKHWENRKSELNRVGN